MAVGTLVRRRTLVDAAIPGSGLVRSLTLVTAGTLLVALVAQIRIPLPFTPVPITGQTYGVLVVGALLGSWRGTLSLGLYLLGAGLGLPFFTGGASGWPAGPSGGYIVGFVLAALVVGWFSERGWDRRFGTAVAAMLLGEVAVYLVGLPWLAMFVGAANAVPLGLLPFIPGDAIKLLLAALTLPLGWKLSLRGL